MTAPPPRTHFLRTLGLAGWDALDPVFLAAKEKAACGPALLHNMSVPPRSVIRLASPGLPGRTFATSAPADWRGFDPDRLPPQEKLEAAFASAGLPDLVGVFTQPAGDREVERRIGYPLALALLARRSGHLYLPWRPVYPPLLPSSPLFLVFPDEGSPA